MQLTVAVLNLQDGIGVTRGYQQYVTSGWRYVLPHDRRGFRASERLFMNHTIDLALCLELGARNPEEEQALILQLKQAWNLPHVAIFRSKRPGRNRTEASAIFSRYPITHMHSHTLGGGILPRVLGTATIEHPEGVFTAAVAHLALGRARRTRQLQELTEHLRTRTGPYILGGDFNERDHSAFRVLEHAGLRLSCAEPSFPSWQPTHALQALFVTDEFSVTECKTADTTFSDHAPLITTLHRVPEHVLLSKS